MNTTQNPNEFLIVYHPEIRKSKNGVSYTHYKRYYAGQLSQEPNRKGRREMAFAKPFKTSSFLTKEYQEMKKAIRDRVTRKIERAQALKAARDEKKKTYALRRG